VTDARGPTPSPAPPSPPAPPDVLPAHYGRVMMRRLGWFTRISGLYRGLRQLRMEPHSVERIRDAAARGPVVYVLLHASTLDHLALNVALNRRRLPLSSWTNGAGISFYWQPVIDAWRDALARMASRLRGGGPPDPVASGWLTRQVASGEPVTLFLRDADGPLLGPEGHDPLAAVVAAQEHTARAIQLVPVLVVWDRSPESARGVVQEFLLGSREQPGLLTKLRAIYAPSVRTAFIQTGEPVDLPELCRRVQDPAARAPTLRALLRRYLTRESRTIRGPVLLPPRQFRQLVLDDPPLRAFVQRHGNETGRGEAAVAQEVARELDKVSARFSFGFIQFLSVVMRPLWSRVFSGYHIPGEDLERIRAAMRDGTAVLVPCHKSHFDYLLLSWILYHDDLSVPHVVAGINLAIWPVHHLLRAAGGFFIRRSFDGEPVHAAVFSRYLRALLLHEYPVEFFIEGGRTRTGRLLPARLGVLGMVLDAATDRPHGREVTLLPIAISYEAVAEEGAYRSELGGAKKEAESMGQLLRSRSVLRRRFGRVHVRVGRPIRASEVVDVGESGWSALDEAAKRRRTQRTGDRLVHGIGEVVVVLPTSLLATALLGHPHQAIRDRDLRARVGELRVLLGAAGAPEADILAERPDAALAAALERLTRDGRVRPLAADGDRVWHVPPDARVGLDLHRNQILHHLAPVGFVATALAAAGGEAPLTALVTATGRLRSLLQREFTLDPDAGDANLTRHAVDDLVAAGLVVHDTAGPGAGDDVVRWAADTEEDARDAVRGTVRSLLEAYALVAREARVIRAAPESASKLVERLLEDRDTWIATGVITRPEALVSVTLTHAVKALRDLGALEAVGDDRHAPVRAVPEVLAEVRSWLDPLVAR
jgi:glycerol-3-phosphate O-acyltransferase